MVLVCLVASGCLPLRADALAKTGARNEVAAIRDARGRHVEAEGNVLEVRLAQATQAQKTGKFRDNGHSPAVELITDEGTPVRCYLDELQPSAAFVAGRRSRLSGKLYDIQQEVDGRTLVILQRCRAMN